jgi:hypothetical protein
VRFLPRSERVADVVGIERADDHDYLCAFARASTHACPLLVGELRGAADDLFVELRLELLFRQAAEVLLVALERADEAVAGVLHRVGALAKSRRHSSSGVHISDASFLTFSRSSRLRPSASARERCARAVRARFASSFFARRPMCLPPLAERSFGVAIGADDVTLSDFVEDFVGGVFAGRCADCKAFRRRISMIVLHHVRRVFDSAVLARPFLERLDQLTDGLSTRSGYLLRSRAIGVSPIPLLLREVFGRTANAAFLPRPFGHT